MDLEPLIEKLRQKQAELDECNRQAAVLRVQIETFKEAIGLMGHDISAVYPLAMTMLSHGSVHAKPGRLVRGLSKVWAQILGRVEESYSDFGYQEILKVAEALGTPTKLDTARAQMKSYVDLGLAIRISDGKFRLSDFGSQTVAKAWNAISVEAFGPPGTPTGFDFADDLKDQDTE